MNWQALSHRRTPWLNPDGTMTMPYAHFFIAKWGGPLGQFIYVGGWN